MDGPALLVLQEFFLAKDIHPYFPQAFFDVFIKLRFLAELNIFNSGFNHIDKQADCVSGYKQERN
ncbi:Uncharacterised protein [Mycobacteroides abscessus subsp. abscessus]|nr:Uncharacterised protein [Mycobacteroides abscessus subsp. abscessus]